MLSLWSEQLESSAGRELLASALCRTMSAVAGDGCARVCPMANGGVAALRTAVGELVAQLGFATEHAELLSQRLA